MTGCWGEGLRVDNPESLIGDLESLISDLESRIGDPESLIGDPVSLIGDLESRLGDFGRSLRWKGWGWLKTRGPTAKRWRN